MATEAPARTAVHRPSWGVATWLAWWHLVVLSFRRQWWSLQTLLAVLLLAVVALFVGVRAQWGWRPELFANFMIGSVYISFMVPIFCLSFGTNSLGGDWEERSLVWLLTRPLPRPLIYLAKFVATLPWTFALTIGGLALLSVVAGNAGRQAFRYCWPAVAWGTLAYLCLFVLMGVCFRRSTVIAVVYSFVLETLFGNMPGLLKRVSLAFYARCLMFDAGLPGVSPEQREQFMPVSGTTALQVLALVSFVLFFLGMLVFSRREYHDLT